MNTIEKFYSDAIKTTKKQNENFDDEIIRLFLRSVSLYDKRLTDLANDFADYWLNNYGSNSTEKLPQEKSVEWFYKMLSFLTDQFESDMDFNKNDWAQINLIVSSSADELDMEILNRLMTIIVERKKL